MKKLLTSFLVALLMIGTLASSHALTLTFNVSPLTNWDFGIASSGGHFFTTFLPAISPFDVTVPSFVGYGQAVQREVPPPPPAHATETFNYSSGVPATPVSALVAFDLYVAGNPGTAHTFLLEGTITGGMNGTSSTTTMAATGLRDITTGTLYTNTIVRGGNTYFWGLPDIGGNPVMLGILKEVLLSPPSNPAGNSLQGFVDVPEPGTVGLLLGSGVSASLVFLRRRKA